MFSKELADQIIRIIGLYTDKLTIEDKRFIKEHISKYIEVNVDNKFNCLNNALDQAIFRLKHYATNTDKSPQAKNTLRCFLKQINDIKEGKEKE
jgi:hypothetical protein